MEQPLIPQLRVVMNTVCGKHCKYCRPSGEAACSVPSEDALSTQELLACIQSLVRGGVQEVRLTGGDPAFYPHDRLAWLIRELSGLGLHRVSLVTRSHRIRSCLSELKEAGLTHLTFSLDSMDSDRWVDVCGIGPERRSEHRQLLETVVAAHEMGFTVNLNCVLLDATCRQELPLLVDFARSLSIGLKVEEVIRDIGENTAEYLHADLDNLKKGLRRCATRVETVFVHGGLGHPMETLHLEGGASVTWKMFKGGACYGPLCRVCSHFPCDDALMALRLLPNGKLQTCLKRSDNLLDLAQALKSGCSGLVVRKALEEYRHAERFKSERIEALRVGRMVA